MLGDMDADRPRTAPGVVLAATTRLGFAVWFLARPEAVPKVLDIAPSAGTRALARTVAVRELVLGVGALSAWASARPTAPWLTAMAVADAVNGSATFIAGVTRVVPRRRALALAAFDLSGTAWELAIARRLTHR